MKKKQENMKLQWTKFIVVLVLYLLFLLWLQSWLGLIVIPFIYDAYISKKINWQWWKDAESPVRFIMSWVDALVFALVAVYFINLFFFQNYVIPSSSLEKSLLTGDYLFVSKASYGPRIPQTPLTMPLTQHTMPVLGCKSYIEWPQWDYRRAPGLGKVELNDIVVFNYPAGDSIMTEEAYQTNYYEFCYKYGTLAYLASKGYEISNPEQMIYYPDLYSTFEKSAKLDSISDLERYKLYSEIYQNGRSFIASKVNQFGRIDSRPTDRRENYVKRCVGLPGQTLQIKNHIIYLDGKPNKEPENVQYSYVVKLNVSLIPDELLKDISIRREIELDESYFGGRRKGNRGRGAAGKVPVFGILTREGKVHVEVVPNVQAQTLLNITVKKVRRGSIVYTDKYKAYDSLMFCGYRHLNVDHSSKFVDGKVHINGLEGFWSWAKERLFKHHGISPKHFPLYLKELEFRYNHRFELIFEQLVAFMSDFIPELPDEAEPSLSSTSQRE